MEPEIGAVGSEMVELVLFDMVYGAEEVSGYGTVDPVPVPTDILVVDTELVELMYGAEDVSIGGKILPDGT